MRIIDNEGFLIGWINIIDVLVVLLVHAAATTSVVLVTASDDTVTHTQTVTVRTTPQPDYVIDAITEGTVHTQDIVIRVIDTSIHEQSYNQNTVTITVTSKSPSTATSPCTATNASTSAGSSVSTGAPPSSTGRSSTSSPSRPTDEPPRPTHRRTDAPPVTDNTTRLETSVANSRIVRWLTGSNTPRTATAIARAPQHARLTRLLHTVARWTRASSLLG